MIPDTAPGMNPATLRTRAVLSALHIAQFTSPHGLLATGDQW